MNPPKVSALDYINFLLASPKQATCTEAAQCTSEGGKNPAHDAFNSLLHRQSPDTSTLWQEASRFVNLTQGALVLDDSTADKPYASDTELVTYHWSGKHHAVVLGINLLTLLWTDNASLIPCDFRIYDKHLGGSTKNEHFQKMLRIAK